VTVVGSLPDHLPGFESEMGHSAGEIALERAQHQWCLPASSQGHQLVKLCRFGANRHLGINSAYPLEQMRGDTGPADRVVTTNYHQLLRGDPGLPDSRGAEPASYVEIGDYAELLSRCQHGQPEPGESEPGMTDETGDPPRLKCEQVGRRGDIAFVIAFEMI